MSEKKMVVKIRAKCEHFHQLVHKISSMSAASGQIDGMTGRSYHLFSLVHAFRMPTTNFFSDIIHIQLNHNHGTRLPRVWLFFTRPF